MTSWSDLDYDVLGHIIAFLPLADHHRFSAICHNWRWVAKHKHCSPCAQLPWLVMWQEASGVRRKFFNLTENREYYIDIPHLYEQYCCGSSHGWLFIVDLKFKGRLLNPFTREFYELPEFPEMDKNMHRGWIIKAILSDDPSVKSDFTVVFLYARDMQAFFWCPGDIYYLVRDIFDGCSTNSRLLASFVSLVVGSLDCASKLQEQIKCRCGINR